MTKTISLVLGIVFLLAGIAGFVWPTLLGFHLSPAHTVIHFVSGALAIYFGTAGSIHAAHKFCLIFGLVYLLLGLAGFAAGRNDSPSIPGMVNMPSDKNLLKVIPGMLELGTVDHVYHVLNGALFILASRIKKGETRNG